MQTNPTQLQFSIPIKICDGMFLADIHIAQDIDFFQTNLISHVINCAGQQVPNSKNISQNKNQQISYLTFDWSENVIQNITEQKVISVLVGFIQECRRQAGCLLIHYANSESRPFCLLACYFMVKYKWSLFKTLQFLNSRKEEVELQPAFFQQLTAFSQKLQDKGLIRSKTWVVSPGMSEDEIIITNTYLNSKNRHTPNQNPPVRKRKNTNSIVWKKQIAQEYNYCPHSIIAEKKAAKIGIIHKKPDPNVRPSSLDRNDKNVERQRISSQTQDLNKKNDESINALRSSLICENRERSVSSGSVSQMNVTKKWAQLREMWLKQKENQNSQNSHTPNQSSNSSTEMSRKQQPQFISKKENQKVNDRLQQKLNMLKKHELKYQNNSSSQSYLNSSQNKEKNTTKQFFQENSKNEYKKEKAEKKNSREDGSLTKKSNSREPTDRYEVIQERNLNIQNVKAKEPKEMTKERVSSLNNKENHQNSKDNNTNSRILHNNWIIDNQMVYDNNKKVPNKTGSNKSVIIIKPNHATQNTYSSGPDNNQGSRSSLRKSTASERKQDKNKQNTAKFFRNQAAQILSTKGRSNSAKPQRKQTNTNVVSMSAMNLNKNNSLKGKGKWKF